MPKPSQLLEQTFKEVDDTDRKKLKELGRIIDSLWTQGTSTESFFSPGGGGSPVTPGDLAAKPFLTVSADGDLTAERVLTAGFGILSVDAGANGALTISVNQAMVPVWTGLHTFNAGLAVAASQNVTLGGDVRLVRDATNTLRILTDAGAGFTERIRVNNAGVGIFKSTDANAALDVAGAVIANDGFNAGLTSSVRWYEGELNVWRTPDSVTIDVGLNLGSGSGADTGEINALASSATDLTWTVKNSNSGTGAKTALLLENDLDNGFEFSATSSTFTPEGVIAANSGGIRAFGASLFLVANTASSYIAFAAGSTAEKMRLTAAGQLQVVTTGSGAGILVGGDVQLYRSGLDTWTTPNKFQVNKRLTVGGASTEGILIGGTAFLYAGNSMESLVVRSSVTAEELGGSPDDAQFYAKMNDTSGGDAKVVLGVTGGSAWQIGLDNSDGDILKIAQTSVTDQTWANTRMTMDLSGNTTFVAGVNIGSASSAATGEARASVGFAARTDGSGAGYWAGATSDVQLYRSGADTWRTPDSLQIDAGVGVGGAPSGTTIKVYPDSASAVYIQRRGTGSGSGEAWGYYILAQDAGDNFFLVYTSSAFQPTSGFEWIGNSMMALYYPFELRIGTGVSSDPVLTFTSARNVAVGGAALATSATDGFLYVSSCAGTPTGTPTTLTGRVPIIVDTTNNKLYFYSGGAWRDAGP